MDRLYPLAPSVWGVGEEIELQSVAQVPLFGEFGQLHGSVFVPVLLHANPLNGAWSVRRLLTDGSQGTLVGEIPWPERGRFEDMRRVEASLLMPVTAAEIRLDTEAGLYRVAVILPPPPLAVPRNDTAERALVLPPGDMVVVDTTAGEFTAEELSARSPGAWFVALHQVGGTIAATLGDKVLGGFAPDDAAELAEYVRAATRAAGADEGAPVFARAVLLDGMAALNVAGPAEGLQTVPALKVPDLTPTTPWSLVDFPDGTWAVTVERPFAIDPGDKVRPRHTARYVSLIGVDRPEEVAAPTEMFTHVGTAGIEGSTPTSLGADSARAADAGAAGTAGTAGTAGAGGADGASNPAGSGSTAISHRRVAGGGQGQLAGAEEYLSEVEKVRLRRLRRAAGATGRHRR